jgi:hypothetical protein
MIVEHEMLWTVESFRFKKREWTARAGQAESGDVSAGHIQYALKQAAMYGKFADQACGAFRRTEAMYKQSII